MSGLWIDVEEATGPPIGTVRLRVGDTIERICSNCDAAFPQTDDGWAEQKQHQFSAHGRTMTFDWSELDGQQVTIRVVERRVAFDAWDKPRTQIDLVAVAVDGTVYFLGDTGFAYGDDEVSIRRGHKCRPQSRARSLLGLTPGEAEPRSNGSATTDVSPDYATAGSPTAKAGKWPTSMNSSGPSTTGSLRPARSHCSKGRKSFSSQRTR